MVFRVQVEATDGQAIIPCSLILKVVQLDDQSSDPAGFKYWKREALAYQMGMLGRLPGGHMIAPACYGVYDQPDGSVWICLEDIKDDISGPWPVERYAMIARHLGQFNGAYLTGQAIPSASWIPHNWLRKYTENAAPMIEFLRKNPHHPTVMHMFPGNAVAQLLAIWDLRDPILKMLENLPQVFCHQDAFRRNLFTHHGKTVAIDWGYMGNAPVGAELVALVAGSLGLFEIPADQVFEMDRLCFEGYLRGLADAGWHGDPKIVRTGYAVTLLLRYPIAAQIGEMLPWMLVKGGNKKVETAFTDKTLEQLEHVDPAVVAYYEKMLPEALMLLGFNKLFRVVSMIGSHTLQIKAKKGHKDH